MNGAFYDGGEITVSGTEDLTLNNASVAPWSVIVDSVPYSVSLVQQVSTFIFLQTNAPEGTEMLLGYSGGGYVTGATSGLALEPVTGFPIAIT